MFEKLKTRAAYAITLRNSPKEDVVEPWFARMRDIGHDFKRNLFNHNARRLSDLLMTMIIRIGVIVAVITSAFTLLLGFKYIFSVLTGMLWIKKDDEMAHAKAIAHLVASLEMFLLAPLPFLILRSLARYGEDLYKYRRLQNATKIALLETKSLAAALVFMMLATNLVGKFLNQGAPHAPHTLAPQAQASDSHSPSVAPVASGDIKGHPIFTGADGFIAIGTLAILLLFFHMLEKLATLSEEKHNKTPTDPREET